ncbi:MAG TPA: DUF2817 domain-containing protein [Dongiaceae bacterium]|nr:DUF2817 domain-containing protein [Dongiaceae bacterium]
MRSPLLSEQTLSAFSDTYASARQQYLHAVSVLPQPSFTQTLEYAGSGPLGEALATDVCWLGPQDADKVVVLLSAVHGVEGFAGSAIQTDLLRRLGSGEARLPEGMAVLFVHAVNPWGFAWCRRCDEQGIDINRNFVDFSQPAPCNDGYRELESALIPADGDWTRADATLAQYMQTHGQFAYEVAASGGQYEFADGLFFGGRAPAQARRNLEWVLQRWDWARRQVAVIDLHTGLGPYGYGELICDHPLNSEGLHSARRWFGASVTVPEEGNSCSVPKLGLVDYAWHAILGRNSCYVTLEYGTFPIAGLLRTLREDHAVRKPGPHDWYDPACVQVRDRLRLHFYPGESQWQTLVLLRARQVVQLACTGLLQN